MLATRRDFLKISMGSALFASNGMNNSGRVLVVLQLAGGNDGLNTVVPYEDDNYARNRTTLRLTGEQVHKIGHSLGFHPELRGFTRLFQEGQLSVLQGVGYPNMNRDHGSGMRNWQTGNVLSFGSQTGWLGRVADRTADIDAGDVPVAFVGRIAPPLSIHAGQVVVPSIHSARDWTFGGAPSTAGDNVPPREALLHYATRTRSAAQVDSKKVSAVLRAGSGLAYPAYPLAQSFQTVAQLIRADLGVRVFLVEHGGAPPGGFDNHANQAGNHAVSLRELSDSVAAFCDDMAHDKLLDRVLLMTYSEFGRTLSENGRHGTGHGAAAPVFLAGGKLKGGLHGAHPSLGDLDNDAPKPHTDFRAVYATVLERWLGLASETVLGQSFAPLDVLAG